MDSLYFFIFFCCSFLKHFFIINIQNPPSIWNLSYSLPPALRIEPILLYLLLFLNGSSSSNCKPSFYLAFLLFFFLIWWGNIIKGSKQYRIPIFLLLAWPRLLVASPSTSVCQSLQSGSVVNAILALTKKSYTFLVLTANIVLAANVHGKNRPSTAIDQWQVLLLRMLGLPSPFIHDMATHL